MRGPARAPCRLNGSKYCPRHSLHPLFGTRCSTLAMIGYDGSLYIQERRFDANGDVIGQSGWNLAAGEWPAGGG